MLIYEREKRLCGGLYSVNECNLGNAMDIKTQTALNTERKPFLSRDQANLRCVATQVLRAGFSICTLGLTLAHEQGGNGTGQTREMTRG